MTVDYLDYYYKNGIAKNQKEANEHFLKDLCVEGLTNRGITPEDMKEWKVYTERLNYELDIINSGNLADFFLNTAFIVLKLKSKGIPVGISRGSAGGSLVCYCLKITEIDPIKFGLLFERFLNPTRVNSINSADIDTDVSKKHRKEVLKIIKKDFGEDRTYQVLNKIKWTPKVAIDDLGRISGVSPAVRRKISKMIGDSNDIESIPEVVEYLNKHPFIRDNYPRLVGRLKTYGVHAGAMVILDKDVEYRDSIIKVNGVDCLDNDGKTADSLGFLKNDTLGLNSLDIVADCLDLLPGVSVPKTYDDPKVFKNINEKGTLGLFQIESPAATEVCESMQPQNFDELSAVVALCRPGPKDAGDTELYIKRKHGEIPIEYDHPLLEPVLKDTYGCIVYQEDAMRIVTDFAGMTPVDADNIRKGIGKKLQHVFDEYYPKFIQSCVENGIEKNVAERVWAKMEASASYSFNKAHCVGYTALTYIFAWLRTYYPVEFLLSCLNNTDKEDKKSKLYHELRNLGKDIVNPDINKSKEITMEDDNNIYLSFTLVKGIGPSAIPKIINGQPYQSFEDFCDRSGVNKTVKKALIECGAFDCFGVDRDILYNKIEPNEEPTKWSEQDKLLREFQRIKINPQGNVLDLYDIKKMGIDINLNTIQELFDNTEDYNDFFIKGLVTEYKDQKDYAYLSVTDGFKVISIFIGAEFKPRYVDVFEVGTPLLLHVNGKGTKYSLLSLINLLDPMKYQHEYWLYNGQAVEKLKALQSQNQIPCGIASNVKYFVSKKGNPCVRYDLQIDEDNILEGRIKAGNPPLMVEGSYVFFVFDDNEVFLDILEVH